jgi:hypothetical protein
LTLDGVTVDNAGGTISAGSETAGGFAASDVVTCEGSTVISGGTLAGSSWAFSGAAEFDGYSHGPVDITNFNYTGAGPLTLAGTFSDLSTLPLYTQLYNIDIGDATTKSATFNGGGFLAIGGTVTGSSGAADTLVNGAGSVLSIVGINATISNLAVVNDGIITNAYQGQATGALTLDGVTVDNAGGTISAGSETAGGFAASDVVTCEGPTVISGGTLAGPSWVFSGAVELDGYSQGPMVFSGFGYADSNPLVLAGTFSGGLSGPAL